eukprot:5957911-Pleurochrysis_carterae.AAC.1
MVILYADVTATSRRCASHGGGGAGLALAQRAGGGGEATPADMRQARQVNTVRGSNTRDFRRRRRRDFGSGVAARWRQGASTFFSPLVPWTLQFQMQPLRVMHRKACNSLYIAGKNA